MFLFVLIAWIAGVGFATFFNISKITALGILLVASVLVVLYAKQPRYLVVTLLVLCVGISALQSISVRDRQSSLGALLGGDEKKMLTVAGRVESNPERVASGIRFVLSAITYQDDATQDDIHVDERILVTADMSDQLSYGDVVYVSGELSLPFEGDEHFDYRAYLARKKIYTVMKAQSLVILDASVLDAYVSGWTYAKQSVETFFLRPIYSFKNTFERSINRAIPEPNAAFTNGILLGTTRNIPDELKEQFSVTGTTHVLAISGYNITVVGALIGSLLLWFMRRQYAFWFTVVGIMAFVIMTGAEASVVRAGIMGVLVLLARTTGRMSQPMTALLLAAVVMLVANPLILRFDVGFQLSFMATVGLLYVSPIITPLFRWLPERFAIRENAAMTVSAQIAVLPIIMYQFGQVSMVSIPVNILILPFIPFAMLCGFMTGLVGLLAPPVAYIIGAISWLVTEVVLQIIVLASKLQFLGIYFYASGWMVLMYYGVLVCVLLYAKRYGTAKEK